MPTEEKLSLHDGKEVYVIGNRQYGSFYRDTLSGTIVVTHSYKDFEEYAAALESGQEVNNGIVVTSELMTVAGIPLVDIGANRRLIEERIRKVREISQMRAETILLPTPWWSLGNNKPQNSVLTIRDGKVICITVKRTNSDPTEYTLFDFTVVDLAPVQEVQFGTAILVCSDFAWAAMNIDQSFAEDKQVFIEYGKYWMRPYNRMPEFVSNTTETLIVPMIWGVGSIFTHNSDPNEYYYLQLQASARNIFNKYPNVKDIITVDRSIAVQSQVGFCATVPFNCHFRRSNGPQL